MTLGFATYMDAVAILIGTSILAALMGAAIGVVFGEHSLRRGLLTVGFAVAVSLASSFFVIQFEWTGDPGEPNAVHPWPESAVAYILLAIMRCTLVGGLIGYVISAALVTDIGDSFWRYLVRHAGLRTLGIAFVAAGAIVCSWAPYWSLHQEERANIRLLTAIQATDKKSILAYADAVKDYRGGADAVSRVAYLATSGRNKEVRMAALDALKLFDAEGPKPLLRATRQEVLRNEISPDIRAAAAEWMARENLP